MTVLMDPTAGGSVTAVETVARPTSIKNLRIGLLDISKPRGDIFLDRLEEHLTNQGAQVSRYSKPTFTKPAPVDLRHEIASNCDAVIEALAD